MCVVRTYSKSIVSKSKIAKFLVASTQNMSGLKCCIDKRAAQYFNHSFFHSGRHSAGAPGAGHHQSGGDQLRRRRLSSAGHVHASERRRERTHIPSKHRKRRLHRFGERPDRAVAATAVRQWRRRLHSRKRLTDQLRLLQRLLAASINHEGPNSKDHQYCIEKVFLEADYRDCATVLFMKMLLIRTVFCNDDNKFTHCFVCLLQIIS